MLESDDGIIKTNKIKGDLESTRENKPKEVEPLSKGGRLPVILAKDTEVNILSYFRVIHAGTDAGGCKESETINGDGNKNSACELNYFKNPQKA